MIQNQQGSPTYYFYTCFKYLPSGIHVDKPKVEYLIQYCTVQDDLHFWINVHLAAQVHSRLRATKTYFLRLAFHPLRSASTDYILYYIGFPYTHSKTGWKQLEIGELSSHTRKDSCPWKHIMRDSNFRRSCWPFAGTSCGAFSSCIQIQNSRVLGLPFQALYSRWPIVRNDEVNLEISFRFSGWMARDFLTMRRRTYVGRVDLGLL